LVKGGSDVLLVETVFDTLNAAALCDWMSISIIPVSSLIISGTVTDASGRILSGQTVTALGYQRVRHAHCWRSV
jgi:5-methyltetrahydrofolate--homocysteine methyltransferase